VPRFDRYLLSQLMVLFGFFSLVLILIYWINRAVVLFDQIIADGQSAWVFLELTALSLPGLMRIVLPLAAFIAAVYVTNRMATESELVVVQATGYSPWRLARPVAIFGLIITVMVLVLSHVLVPLAQSRLIDRQADLSRSLTTRFLTEGQFLSPASGVTFYIREITPEGELQDIFLSDTRREDRQFIYTAAQAFLVPAQSGPQLVMIDGLTQVLLKEEQRLYTTRFDDFAYDVSALIPVIDGRRRSISEIGTLELLRASEAVQEETRRSAATLIHAAHDRSAQSLFALFGALVGFSTLLVGGFSRFGLWRQIVAAVFIVVFAKGIESVGAGIARGDARLWLATYLAPLSGLVICALLLHAATRPYLLRRKPRPITVGEVAT